MKILKRKAKKISAMLLSLTMILSMFMTGIITGSAASTADYKSISSVTFNIHKGEIDEQTAEDDSEGHIGNTDGLTGTTSDCPADFKGLKDANFKMYKVGDINTTVDGTTNGEKITHAWEYVHAHNVQGKALPPTDQDGLASITINKADFGLYLVEEVTPTPDAVTTTAADFLVYLPMTAQNDNYKEGKEWLTVVDIYPKNLVTLGGAVLTKTINTAEYNEDDLEQQPEFKLVELTSDSEVVIAENIKLANGYTPITLTETARQGKRYVTTTIAQKSGKIAVDGLPVGNYQFVETKAGRLVDDTEDLAMDVTPRKFSVVKGNNVDVVTTGGDDFATITGNKNELTVKLSNDNSRLPEPKKEVQKRDGTWTEGDGGTWAIDLEDVTWKVTADIPADLETYKKYTLTDVIDTRLDFVLTDDSVRVDEGLGLTKNTDYTISYEEGSRTLTVDVTESGRKKLGAFPYKEKVFSFDFDTQINSTAVVDEYIDNQAVLHFENSYGISGDRETNIPKVRTGGLCIKKVDADNREVPLKGIEFILKDHTGKEIKVKQDSEGHYTVDESGSSKVITDSNGEIFIKGLHYTEGDVSVYTHEGENQYTLTEVKTNNGYQLLVDPIKVLVTDGTYDKTNEIEIINYKQPDLPFTGGIGNFVFWLVGALMLGGAVYFFLYSRKEKKETE